MTPGGASAPAPTPTPTGPVQSASVNPEGNVLSLVLNGVSAGTWGSYPVGGDNSMGVTLAAAGAGFDRAGGQAVANAARARALKALRPKRRTPIVPTSTAQHNSDVLDEVDNGDGTRTVRLALERHVYAGEVATVSLAAGWRTGAAAQATIAVTNSSAIAAAPVVGGRWITVPNQRVTGLFRVELIAGSVNPEGRSGLAAVRFDVTDGTTTKTVWVDALSTGADGVRCWGATIDPAGLNPGLITVHKTLFPWVGPSRTSGTGQGTATSSMGNGADVPLVMAHDPLGTRYPEAWVVCDPVNGTATASAAMVQSTLAAAKAVAAASKPISVSTAVQALYLANRSAAAANGQAALTRMADGAKIVVPAGVTPMAGTAITTGTSATECWPVVMGDPDLADPRSACAVEVGASGVNWRLTRMAWSRLTMRVGGVLVGVASNWLDQVQVEGKTGQEASTLFLSSTAAGRQYVTGSAIGTATAVNFSQAGAAAQLFQLVRSSTSPRGIGALAIVGSSATSFSGWTANTTAEGQADWVCVANAALRVPTSAILWPLFASGGYDQCVRPLVLNTVIERTGASGQPLWQIGENQLQRFTHAVIEGVTAVGERTNTLYNDPPDLVSRNAHTDCRVANCYFDWMPTKHDDYFDDTTSGTNGGAPNYGYRPWLTDNLWFQDGTNCEGNVLGRRMQTNFEQKGSGIRSLSNPAPGTGNYAGFVSDASALGSGADGGDYRPAAGSVLRARAVNANLDADRAGVARGKTFSAGALEGG